MKAANQVKRDLRLMGQAMRAGVVTFVTPVMMDVVHSIFHLTAEPLDTKPDHDKMLTQEYLLCLAQKADYVIDLIPGDHPQFPWLIRWWEKPEEYGITATIFKSTDEWAAFLNSLDQEETLVQQ
jgi:hypothetical protein